MPGPRNLPSLKKRTISTANVRQDGRPEAYDIELGAMVGCIACMSERKIVGYPRKEVFMVNPHDNPLNSGVECYLCKEHLKMFLPNVVIVDPANGFECRDLSGKTWREGGIIIP